MTSFDSRLHHCSWPAKESDDDETASMKCAASSMANKGTGPGEGLLMCLFVARQDEGCASG